MAVEQLSYTCVMQRQLKKSCRSMEKRELGSEQEVLLTFKSCFIAIHFYYHSWVWIPHLLTQQTHEPIKTSHSNHISDQHT